MSEIYSKLESLLLASEKSMHDIRYSLTQHIPHDESEELEVLIESLETFFGTVNESLHYINLNSEEKLDGTLKVEPTEKTAELIKRLNHAGNSSISGLITDVYDVARYNENIGIEGSNYGAFINVATQLVHVMETMARQIVIMLLKDNYYDVKYNSEYQTVLFLDFEKDSMKRFKVFNTETRDGCFGGFNEKGHFKTSFEQRSKFDILTHHKLYDIKPTEKPRDKQDIKNLIDIAIDTRDEVWFNKLVEELKDGSKETSN